MITVDSIDRGSWERILPNFFDVETLRHLGGAALARALLAETGRSVDKERERRDMLRDHPELGIQVDTAELREIIDYLEFKCHPECSVARGEAVRGSDVDNGLVVLREPVDTGTEIAFVEVLRCQGFDVSHQTDAVNAQNALDTFSVREYDGSQTTAADWQRLDQEFFKLAEDARLIPLKQIRFVTETDIARRAEFGPLDPETAVYLAGYNIG